MEEIEISTVFLSDLDGTLLHNDCKLSDKTIEIINDEVKKGRKISISTARGISVFDTVAKGLNLSAPAVMMNGVFIADPKTKKYISCEPIDSFVAQKLIDTFNSFDVAISMYMYDGEGVHVRYSIPTCNDAKKIAAGRKRPDYVSFEGVNKLPKDVPFPIIYFSTFQKFETVKPVYEAVKEIAGVTSVFYDSTYEDKYFLEVFSNKASKGNGALKVKKLTGADTLVTFGDNLNDVEMTMVADIGCAMSNARQGLKDVADEIIGSNEEDGVAKYIQSFKR